MTPIGRRWGCSPVGMARSEGPLTGTWRSCCHGVAGGRWTRHRAAVSPSSPAAGCQLGWPACGCTTCLFVPLCCAAASRWSPRVTRCSHAWALSLTETRPPPECPTSKGFGGHYEVCTRIQQTGCKAQPWYARRRCVHRDCHWTSHT